MFLLLCGVAYWAESAPLDGVRLPWYSVVPPLLAVCLAVATQRIMLSLAVAVLVGGYIAKPGLLPSAGITYFYDAAADSFNQQLLAFVVLVMAMIGVMVVAGGLQGVVKGLGRFAKGPKSTQVVTAIMGLAIFIDDYANTMIVGSSMRPVTDAQRVSREKLAFIVDATSAPVAGLAVISTWVGYEISQIAGTATQLGIEDGAYALLFDALPYRFYCLLMIAFVLINVITGSDYGPMARAERRARNGEPAAPDAEPMTSPAFTTSEPAAGAVVRARTAVVPIGFLFAFLLVGIWFDGGGGALITANPFAVMNPGIWRDVISASENSVKILAFGAGGGLLCAWALGAFTAHLGPQEIGRGTLRGLQSSLLPCLVLLLAWSLKNACDALETGAFLERAAAGAVSPILYPAVVFVVAGMVAFCTGTSYGTMAILIPTAVPIAFSLDGGVYGTVTMLTIASILDGAIFGDHCSPISDTTIMSSISSACDHLHHVRTQLPYALTVAGTSLFLGYLPAAYGVPFYVTWIVGIALFIGIFLAMRFLKKEPDHAH